MDLTSEAIDNIVQLAKGQTNILLTPIPNDPLGRIVFVKPDQTHEIIQPGPGRHAERLLTVTQIKEFILERFAELANGAAFVEKAGITYVTNVDDRRDRCRMAFTHTPAFAWVKSILTGVTLTQRELIRVLRVMLDGAIPAESNLLNVVRNLKFTSATDGSVNVQHGKESIGKSVMAEIRGEGTIPETFTIVVPVYEEMTIRYPVHIYIEPLPLEQSFFIKPILPSVIAAESATLDDVVSYLRGSNVSAYLGNPDGK